METALILALALGLDLALGEPPLPLHPVAWLGWVITFLEKLAPRRGKRARFLYGAIAALFTLALFSLPAYGLLSTLKGWNPTLYILVAALILKSTFSVRMLCRECLKIQARLEQGQGERARAGLRSLVSRDRARLSPEQMASATVESAAENTADSFIAPLFFFLLLGVPGALAYRAANTLDARWGYHNGYEYLGKFAARLDDAANLLPSRLSGLLIVLAASLGLGDGRGALRVMRRDAGRTASPNAGWPMAAAAGALGVRLEKAGHYSLGEPRYPLTPQVIARAVRLVRAVAGLGFGLALAGEALRYALKL